MCREFFTLISFAFEKKDWVDFFDPDFLIHPLI